MCVYTHTCESRICFLCMSDFLILYTFFQAYCIYNPYEFSTSLQLCNLGTARVRRIVRSAPPHTIVYTRALECPGYSAATPLHTLSALTYTQSTFIIFELLRYHGVARG